MTISLMSHRSSHTHCQATQAQAQTKACQRVCMPQTEKNFPFFKEKINESTDRFNMKALAVRLSGTGLKENWVLK